MVNINHGRLDQRVFAPYISGARTHVQKGKPKMAEFHIFIQCQSLSIVFVCTVDPKLARIKCAEMLCPYIDLKNNIVL
jgi:hypothetical protein